MKTPAPDSYTANTGSTLLGSDPVRLLFFSRGRGRGHAIPDISLMEELYRLDDGIDLRWVSYGTGAATLTELGHQVLDLDLPDENPFLETLLRSTRVIAGVRPHLVVAHEEFASVPAATLFGTPTVFITDYFPGNNHIWMQALTYAREIIFVDERGSFEEPGALRGKIYYAGPMVRHLCYGRTDRARARRELSIPADAMLILVLPGNFFTEERAPIFDLVFSAYVSLANPRKRLMWIGGRDSERLSALTSDHSSVIVKEADWQLDRCMAACDLAITKGTRKTSLELSYLGVPSISLSHGLNPIDDARISRIPTNLHLNAQATSTEELAGHMNRIAAGPMPPAVELTQATGLASCARRIQSHIVEVRTRRT